MLGKLIKHEFRATGRLMAPLFGALVLQLANLQLRNGQDYYDPAESRKMKTYTLKGERGMILDRNGIPLAYDEESYNVMFYRDPSRNSSKELKNYTQILLRVIEIVEQNGGKTVANFYLKRDEDGNDYLDFLTTNEETFAKREKNWRSNLYISKVDTEDIFSTLCERYGIEDLDYETQYKVLSIWQELQMYAFQSKPVAIAYDVNMNTVAQIEAASIDLTGASVEQTTKRVYPRGTLAAHIIGYTGSISEDSLDDYLYKGYSADDRVGVYGIEKSMEDQLSGNISYRQGSREVEVDANGAVMRELSYKAPVDGSNVVLTLDLEMHAIWFCSMNKWYIWQNLTKPQPDYSRFTRLDVVRANNVPDVLSEHREILRVIREKDLDAIEPLIRRHLYGGLRRMGTQLYAEKYSSYFTGI